jgi:hypothetical protein
MDEGSVAPFVHHDPAYSPSGMQAFAPERGGSLVSNDHRYFGVVLIRSEGQDIVQHRDLLHGLFRSACGGPRHTMALITLDPWTSRP